MLTVHLQSGNPENCFINCEGDATDLHSGIVFALGDGPDARVENLTIVNACQASPAGGAIRS